MQMIFLLKLKNCTDKNFLPWLFPVFFQKISNFPDFLWPSNKFPDFPWLSWTSGNPVFYLDLFLILILLLFFISFFIANVFIFSFISYSLTFLFYLCIKSITQEHIIIFLPPYIVLTFWHILVYYNVWF